MLAPILAAIVVTASFEGGNIGRVEQVAPGHLRCAVRGQADQNHRNRQANWYYFRLDNLPRAPVTIDLTDLVGEYNFTPGTHAVTRNTRPVFSYDNRVWTHFTDAQVSWDEKEPALTLHFTPEHPAMWIAHIEPYVQANLARLPAGGAMMKREIAGKTVHGRGIPLLTITDPAAPDAGKKVIWLMARQHAWETGTSWVADGAVRFLLSDDPRAARIRLSAIFKVLPIFDCDGVAEGAVRFNANGYDNNRNWDTVDPQVMPEIAAVKKAILGWLDAGRRIDLFLAMHNDESSDYVEGPLAAFPALSADLANRLRKATNFYDPVSPRDCMRLPVDKGRATVDQDLFMERKVPSFLMEMMVERHPQLGRPRTARDFSEFGTGLARSLAAAAGATP